MPLKVTAKMEADEKAFEEIVKKFANIQFPFSILQKATGMSYRQMNDWESKGYFKAKRTSQKEWRKFSHTEILVLMIALKLVNLGVKAGQTKWLIEELQKENYIETALFWDFVGVRTYLCTDLKSNLTLNTWREISEPARDNNLSIVLCTKEILDKLNIIVLGKARPLDKLADDMCFDKNSEEEQLILAAVKGKKYQEIIINTSKDKLKIKGVSYVDKDISETIASKKFRRANYKVTTNTDENGKITSAAIEEDLSY